MDEIIIKAIESSLTMREACKKVNLPFATFKRKAIKLGLYEPNQSGKGLLKSSKKLDDIFKGKDSMNSNALKKRLIREGHKEYKCEECNLIEWNNKPLALELDHINGNSEDNRLENLRILCPNCHSQTPTFRKKKSCM